MKLYEIYKYVDPRNVKISPEKWWELPQDIDPKKDLFIRPYEVAEIQETGEVPIIVFYADKSKAVKLFEERVVYERDTVGLRTKGLAIKQTKQIYWYFEPEEVLNTQGETEEVQTADEVNFKTLVKYYDEGQATDSLDHKLPTPIQMKEWEKKCKNQVLYMTTKEVAGSPIDQAVFVLLDNLEEVIRKRERNPLSTAFAEAIASKLGGFPIPVSANASLNIWDIPLNPNDTLQQFLYRRITGKEL